MGAASIFSAFSLPPSLPTSFQADLYLKVADILGHPPLIPLPLSTSDPSTSHEMATALLGSAVTAAAVMHASAPPSHDLTIALVSPGLPRLAWLKCGMRPSLLGGKQALSHRMLSPHEIKAPCYSSASNNQGMDDAFDRLDKDYVDSSVVEAVEVKSGADGFLIKMRDGRLLKCAHNNPEGNPLPDYAPQPAIVLKMEDGSNLLLPIIVMELPSAMLMEAIRNVQVARPTVYHIIKDMLDVMGYEAKLVRVTCRVNEAYYARIYLSKTHDELGKIVSLDLRPSDAINLAARCKIPIQVNKTLAHTDGVRIVNEPANFESRPPRPSLGVSIAGLDRSEAESCAASEEFLLVRCLMIAAVEERYIDAARLRDQLSQLRSKKHR